MRPPGLESYRCKRDFRRTPEPRGKAAAGAGGRAFVVQQHAARRLHYDFRLELGGVLKSWAVPKGPSLDPKEKRLAVQVEDHPLEYGGFEGVIPPGQYGAGPVLLWDRGRWAPEGDPDEGLRKGRLKFRLDGQKLQGAWLLVRTKGRSSSDENGKQNWLLIKQADEQAGADGRDLLRERPESVQSGRRIEEIAAPDRARLFRRAPAVERPPGARRAAFPKRMRHQLATLVDAVPRGDEWLHEIKFDGYRMSCRIARRRPAFFTREGKDWTDRFRAVAGAASALPARQAWLDGEIVCLEPDGTTSFQALQNALSANRSDELVYYAFDLLYLDGHDLTAAPLLARKEALARLLSGVEREGRIRFSDHLRGRGQDLYRQACQFGLEGVMSKRADRPYRPGRNRDWLKIRCLQGQEFVIAGFTDPSGGRAGLGALLLGVHDERGALRYSGRVGTGFTDRSLRALRARLNAIEQPAPAVFNPPVGAAARGIHWVKPELVADVKFTGWTRDQVLRHPSFQGLREDKPAAAIVRERPASTPFVVSRRRDGGDGARIAGVTLSNPDRMLYPEQGITKRELARYYEGVARWMLPHLAGRPLMLVRCPHGHQRHCFHQKHAVGRLDQAIQPVPIREGASVTQHLSIDSLRGLIALVQMGVLEIHMWGSRRERVEHPDRLTFDIDPDVEAPWEWVIEAARLVRRHLSALGLGAFVQTTGGKGLHVVVPLKPLRDWGAVKEFSKRIAQRIARDEPDRYVATMTKAKRKGKIFIDYFRNNRGATAIAPYSTRARHGAPVAVPLRWEELNPALRADQFTILNLPQRLARLRNDPWKEYEAARRPVTAVMEKKL